MSKDQLDALVYSLRCGEAVLAERTETDRKDTGQFLTPAPVARFMAQSLGALRDRARVLEPAIGSGVLACAVVERAVREGHPQELWIDGYEPDAELCRAARESLAMAAQWAGTYGITVHVRIEQTDFLLECAPGLAYPSLFSPDDMANPLTVYDYIIANPPYFKLNAHDPRAKAIFGHLKGHTNIYTLFMALATRMLDAQGMACFIVPRSFCSGAYFSAFRRDFLERVNPIAIHLFESRVDTFKKDAVLQENVIVTFQPVSAGPASGRLSVSASRDSVDLTHPTVRQITMEQFLGRHNGDLYFRIPVGELDEQIVDMVDHWPGTLDKYRLEVSTGPVVAFRASALLVHAAEVERGSAVPLLWMQNVRPQTVNWPTTNGDKLQGIQIQPEAGPLLVRTGNYVLLRRFSAKEDARRLIAAPLLKDRFDHDRVGLENHLNFVHRRVGDMEAAEAVGLSALYNSAVVDRYFRITNGNTQVNAAELRALPLPSLDLIREIGEQLLTAAPVDVAADIDGVVFAALRGAAYLLPDFPTIRETRITMGKIQQAQEALRALGMPPAQQNEMSALTLLVLARLSEDTPWSEAEPADLRIHDMLYDIQARYKREYAENTRETVRRQVIHQLMQAGIVARNVDDPSLPTNSPRTRYSLTPETLLAIRTFGSDQWTEAVETFALDRGALLDLYRRSRDQQMLPLVLDSGERYVLSPGKHNEVVVKVIQDFGPRFPPGATVLYVGDTENKTLHMDTAALERLCIAVSVHDKLPDVVLYHGERNRLFLIEVVTSHGPVSPKRHFELEEVLKNCSLKRVYVSAFPDFTTFKGFLTQIAWETEVWLAETPEHMIHFNGDRFLA